MQGTKNSRAIKALTLCLAISVMGSIALAQTGSETTADSMLKAARNSVRNLTTEAFQALIADNADLVVMDVRMPEELALLGGVSTRDDGIWC